MEHLVIGSRFRVHWKGHEACYEGRIYKVKSVLRDCTCPSYLDSIDGREDHRRPPHLHIVATIVESPRSGDCDRSNNWFNGIDPETLTDIGNQGYRLEVVDNTGCQLDLF